jgi:2-oxoglutarate ferredoxin oxidoreductase subunit delta
MAIKGAVHIDIETCKGCELCVEACPQESLALSRNINKKGYHYAVQIQDNCTGCINCALVCPDAVITVYRQSKKKKNGRSEREEVARISNVRSDVSISINEK